MAEFQITSESGDGWSRITLVGEVDIAVADQVREAIVENSDSTVVVDLSGLTFIDSSGIAALLIGRRQVEAGGNRLELRGAQESVRRIFEIVGLAD